MAIKGNVPQGVIDLAAVSVDTVLFDNTERTAISAISIHNINAASREVFIYISPNLTSASGKIVAVYNLSPDESADINELLGQGLSSTEQIIGVQQTAGAVSGDLNCKLTFTQYSGSS